MKKFTAIILCLLLAISPLSFVASAETATKEYQKMTGIVEAIKALIYKDKIINTTYTGEVSTENWNENDKYSLDKTVIIKKEKDKDFVILNLTDIHFSDYDKRAFMAFPAITTIKTLVRRVKPDLITITGDIVCGDSSVYSIKRLTDLMNSFEVPWAPVFGNHEGDTNCDHNYLADIMMKSPYCILKKGPQKLGYSNYIINIAEDNGEKSNIIHSLIMMDTHSTHLNDEQIKWYKYAANGISELMGRDVPSSVFFHIPCVQYQYAYDEAWDSANNRWRDGYNAVGEKNEKICCHRDKDGNPIDNGFFDAVKECGTTKNIICGHEHINDFSILYDGVQLTYTLKVGMGSGYKYNMNGGTVIKIDDNGIKEIKNNFVSQIGI